MQPQPVAENISADAAPSRPGPLGGSRTPDPAFCSQESWGKRGEGRERGEGGGVGRQVTVLAGTPPAQDLHLPLE